MINDISLIILGLVGQFFYFLRFFIQWLYSEKSKKVVIPTSFWIISIIGAILLFIYSVLRRDVVFMIGSIFSLVLYSRNLFLELSSSKKSRRQ